MSIQARSKRVIVGGAVAVGLALGVTALAGAATTIGQPSPTTVEQGETQDPSLNGSIQTPEQEGGSEADESKALEGRAKISPADAEQAAVAAVPGGTVNGSADLGNENGSVVYEVDVTDANNTSIEVMVDAGTGAVLAQETDDEGSEANEAPEADEGPSATPPG